MTGAEVYAVVRGRLLELAHGLDATVAAVTVPALPAWTVKDAYAHLAGSCADLLDGRYDGMPGTAWSARHVRERRDQDLPTICADWAHRGAALDSLLAAPEGHRLNWLGPEVWTHEHDIRGAVGPCGVRDDLTAASVAGQLARLFRRRWFATDLAPIRLVGDTYDWLLGSGQPEATLRASDFELARMLVGRRSRDQMLKMDWDGDPGPFVDHLHLYPPPTEDLIE